MNQKQRLVKRAQVYDQRDRASDYGPGHPPGPTDCRHRQPRAPRATGNAAVLRRLRKGFPALHKLVLAGEFTVYQAAVLAGFRSKHRSLEKEEFWFQEFHSSLKPGFTFDDGPRGMLTGKAAHIAHIVFHNIPAALCARWACEAGIDPTQLK